MMSGRINNTQQILSLGLMPYRNAEEHVSIKYPGRSTAVFRAACFSGYTCLGAKMPHMCPPLLQICQRLCVSNDRINQNRSCFLLDKYLLQPKGCKRVKIYIQLSIKFSFTRKSKLVKLVMYSTLHIDNV